MEEVRIEEGGGLRGRRCNLWVLVAAVFVAAVVGAVVVLTLYLVPYFTKEQYGIVFDAGSSHSDVTLFRWPGAKLRGTGEVIQVTRCEAAGGGISDYADEPAKAGESLQPCLEEARSKVPKKDLAITPVYLGATAGMRLLPENKATPIFDEIGNVFADSQLKYEAGQARIISDQEEGTFAWITANLLLNQLGQSGTRDDTTGTLDMGGASTQISFETNERASTPQEADYGQLRLYGFDFPVYAHSYLCWGTNEATRRYRAILLLRSGGQTTVDDPCHLRGNTEILEGKDIFDQTCTGSGYPSSYKSNSKLSFQGKGDAEACRKVLEDQLDVQECKNMFNGSHCLDPAFIPPIKGKFMGISSYYYVAGFLNITDTTMANYNAAGDKFCQLDYSVVEAIPGQKIQYSKGFCFNINYQRLLLQNVYGFNTEEKWKQLSFIRTIGGVTTGWTLGFMVNATNAIPTEAVRAIKTDLFVALFIIFVILVIVVAIFGYWAWQRKRRRTSKISSGPREATCFGLCCPRK